jgi:hypothetical protein
MAAKLTTLTHKIAIQLQLVAETCTICSSRSRRPVRERLDTPSSLSCLVKDYAMKTKTTYWGSGCVTPCIFNLGTRWRWAVSFMPRPIYPQGNSPQYLLDRRLGGPQSRSGCGTETKNFQPPPEIEPRSSSPWPVAIPTELSRLRTNE